MELKNNKNIIIKEANKRRSVVIMCTKDYRKMVCDHLNDNEIYKKTDSTCDKKVFNKIKKTNPEARNRLLNKFFSFNKQFLWSPKNS